MEPHKRKDGQWSGLLVSALLLVCIGGLSWGAWEGYQYWQATQLNRFIEIHAYSSASPPYPTSAELAQAIAPVFMEFELHGFLWNPPEIMFNEPGLTAQCRVVNNMQQPVKKVRFSWSLQTPPYPPTSGEVEYTAEEVLPVGESAVWTIPVSQKHWHELPLSANSVLILKSLNIWNEQGKSMTEGKFQEEDVKKGEGEP